MAYTKTQWIDQAGQVKYTEAADGDYKIFTPNFDDVTVMGTPVDAIHMNNIENGIEYCDKNMVVRKSTSQATGSATQPVYVKADGTVEVCNIETLGDGSYTYTDSTIYNSTKLQTQTYGIDLSAYLPDYTNAYLVDLYIEMRSKSNEHTTVELNGGTTGGIRYVLSGDSYYTNYEQVISTNIKLPIKGRYLYMRIGNHSCTELKIIAYGYRRFTEAT